MCVCVCLNERERFHLYEEGHYGKESEITLNEGWALGLNAEERGLKGS